MNFGSFLRSTGMGTAVGNSRPKLKQARLLRRMPSRWIEVLAARIAGPGKTGPAPSPVERLGWARRFWKQQVGDSGIKGREISKAKPSLPSMSHLSWALRLWVQRLGVSGAVGLGLLAFAAMFYLSAVLTLEAEQAQILEELESSLTHVRKAGGAPTVAPRTPSEQLADFYAIFPPVDQAPETLRKINQLAEKQHLVLQAGNYHVIDDHTGRLIRYEASLPLVGSYPNVRQFLRTVLAEIPSAALEKVNVEKNMMGGAQAKTTVSFTLFMRRDS